MVGGRNYEPDFSGNEIPVWYVDSNSEVPCHLYPDCTRLNQQLEADVSHSEVKFQVVGSDQEWEMKIRSNRNVCPECMVRFQQAWIEAEL